MANTKAISAKLERFNKLKAAMKFCPTCAKKLENFNRAGDMLTCPDGHGVITITGYSHGNKSVNVVFEFVEE